MGQQQVPFWNVNLPEEEWTEGCPEYLQRCTEREKMILGMPDSALEPLGWDAIKKIVHSSRIDDFRRKPSDHRRYKHYMHELKAKYGSVAEFIRKKRLGWSPEDLDPNLTPFRRPEDIKVLYNDWPYLIHEKIVHLVVWTKFALPEDPDTGLLTEKSKEEIEDYMNSTFTMVDQSERIWFRNWRALKSIKSVEHFHVMLKNPDPRVIAEMTKGDVPMCKKVAEHGSASLL
ncbi:hypothetical protein P152DRAFT_505233 [Eremomyces bilateralis CBS 781.70]|uniref:Uncharacterized protein n=1 Tax=Eremomyces bilateralis CBS 781.70 TaxID=1392243 RepID=A0A6G1GF77_9PEZI|nr:uncharacterized protein P152DRAFT_505233 [Eremomyces bilateralis CBS 781.70]KAF1816703.1 hypothetical protein P152DRAFT_505233 [Eremomyces bilateralis CBS 781.70]